MMRSLYAGVSGLKNHQIRMDVLGNNISNVNTNGFKYSRVTFQDIISQTLSGAARPTDVRGGMNPKQVGLGMTAASIDTIMSQGSLQVTGERTDAAIQGDGFFILGKGDEQFYTRAGNFSVDKENQLVNPNGFKVQGWNAIINTDGSTRIEATGDTQDILVPIGEKFPAKATQLMEMASNLNADAVIVQNPDAPTEAEIQGGGVHRTSLNAFDSQGNEHNVELEFVKVGVNTWRVEANVTSETVIDGSVRMEVGNADNTPNSNLGYVTFDDNGAIRSVSEDLAAAFPVTMGEGELNFQLVFDIQNAEDAAGNPVGYQQVVEIAMGEAGVSNQGVTQFSSTTTTKFVDQDGYGLGYLQEYTINQVGTIVGNYTNGQTRDLAQIALSTFINARGLTKSGDTNFQQSTNSGLANIGLPGSQGKGVIIPASLEMSNVDLAEQFTDMIVTQRGFQANSRTITTSDQLLQELLMLKR
jgi:flagellar hook protein FlgE